MFDLFIIIFSIASPMILVGIGLLRFHFDNKDSSTQCEIKSKEK